MQWTHELDTALRASVKTVPSYALIAGDLSKLFGCVISRNAALGRAHRLGISRTHAAAPRAWAPRKRNSFAREPRQCSGPTKRCSLLELNKDTCRWPFGDPGTVEFNFCGGMVAEGESYCPHHCRLAYRQPGQREEQAA